jgi:hypothetical protein
VAVRHAQDHIYIAAVLVRQDSGRRFWPHQDYPKLRAAARRIEQRLGLTVTAMAEGTAAPPPGRGEVEKAGRQGRVLARVELRRAARQAAVAGSDVDEFVACLQERGYRVGLRWAPSGDLLGYKLARPGTPRPSRCSTAAASSLRICRCPRLRQRWATTPPATSDRTASSGRGPGSSEVLDVVGAVRAALRAGSEDGDGIASVTATCSPPLQALVMRIRGVT